MDSERWVNFQLDLDWGAVFQSENVCSISILPRGAPFCLPKESLQENEFARAACKSPILLQARAEFSVY